MVTEGRHVKLPCKVEGEKHTYRTLMNFRKKAFPNQKSIGFRQPKKSSLRVKKRGNMWPHVAKCTSRHQVLEIADGGGALPSQSSTSSTFQFDSPYCQDTVELHRLVI